VVLRELTIGMVQAMFTALMRTSSARGRPLAPTTLHRFRGALTAALNAAIRRGLLTQNPAHWVELPNGRRPRAVVWTEARVALWRATGERPPLAVWTAEHTAHFLHGIRDHRHYPLFHLVALLGLRRGEVLGLRWSDIDLKARTLVCRIRCRSTTGGG
jgi:integrase